MSHVAQMTTHHTKYFNILPLKNGNLKVVTLIDISVIITIIWVYKFSGHFRCYMASCNKHQERNLILLKIFTAKFIENINNEWRD